MNDAVGTKNDLPEVDRTPPSVLRKIALNETPYPKYECLECGAVIKMGFFFDAFGRNIDVDKSTPTFLSNISRLWDAHKNMLTPHRPRNEYWYPFYYSGLGTDLNDSAKGDTWILTAMRTANTVGGHIWKNTKAGAREISGIPKVDLKERTQKAVKDSILEGSSRPMLQAWNDMRDQIANLGPNALQVLEGLMPGRLIERSTDYVRRIWKDLTHNPVKAVGKLVGEVVKGVAQEVTLENVPIVRDNSIVAYWLGTGFDSRLDAALRQFRSTYDYVRAEMPVRRIEVSIFAADRGGAIARQFANSLVETYRCRNDQDLAIVEGNHITQIRIRFMGLLDSVASIMDENALLNFLPYVDLIKQNFSNRQLDVPAAIEQCVHFAAAHELRFYQRLDSLEQTRGEQYLYPGSSGDVTGVNPKDAQGLRAELSRIPLRDMLHRAVIAGAALMTVEEIHAVNPLIYNQFTLSHSITEDGKNCLVTDLVKAYRDVVPYKEGLDFLPHMKVFLRWLAVRYQDPAFRDAMTAPLERYSEERNVPAAEDAYNDELHRQILMSDAERALPENRNKLDELKARLDQSRTAAESSRGVAPPDFRPIWHRLAEEADYLADLLRKDEAGTEADQPEFVNTHIAAQGQKIRQTHRLPDEQAEVTAQGQQIPRRKRLTNDQAELIRTWQRASKGLDPLPEKVMMLFDALVHDAMLSSWQDHLLTASSLYFRVRDKDIFGVTDYAAETEQRQRDDLRAARIDAMPKPLGLSSNTAPDSMP